MGIGSEIYSYRNNFRCKQKSNKKGRTTKLKLFNLIIKGYRTLSKFDDDYFISIAQYFMKKGYPKTFGITNDTSNIDNFFQESLFSIDPFHRQYLMINRAKFDVFEWRKQFELFNEMKLKGLNFYRSRDSMPLPNYTSMQNIYGKIFSFNYIVEEELLRFEFNDSHPMATHIITKRMEIHPNKFLYCIDYGYKNDFEESRNQRGHSSWTIAIKSEIDENFIDFCFRIFNNYEAILSGDKNVLISDKKEDEYFYLSGNFKLQLESKKD